MDVNSADLSRGRGWWDIGGEGHRGRLQGDQWLGGEKERVREMLRRAG